EKRSGAEQKGFAEPGVAFVHRTDRPSACAYRLLASASTYSRPVLGASSTLGRGAEACKGQPGESCRILRAALRLERVAQEEEDVGGPLGQATHEVREPVRAKRRRAKDALATRDEVQLQLGPDAVEHLQLHPLRPRVDRQRTL